MIDSYETSGRREAMLRFGPATGPIAVVALPLFEEANRVRAFAVTICRALAARGLASVLPDMPGQGESLVPLQSLSSTLDLDDAFERMVDALDHEGGKIFGIAIRSGAVYDKLTVLRGRWHFAPQDGPDLFRTLKRIKQASIGPQRQLGEFWHVDEAIAGNAEDPVVEIAGNLIRSRFLTGLKVDPPLDPEDGRSRIVRLDTDPKPADRYVSGVPLWRRAEPDNDPALATLLADDIADWIATCEG